MTPMSCPARFPPELHYLVAHDVWARIEADGSVTTGITALGIQLSGEIYMCRPQPVGTRVAQGRSIAVVELAKAIVSVKSAVSGTVTAVNPRLADEPECIHHDPYGEGWIARIVPDDLQADLTRWVSGDGVAEAMQRHAAEQAASG
jgi:glycine cleavage system H protein